MPVIAQTTAAALKEAEDKLSADEYMSALRAEEIARNKMNDYAADYFGSFDMIDQNELDRLCQEYQQASEYRKSLEPKYEEPVDMDSWGMNLMRESAWLKNSATENLDGIWKTGADILVDTGQDLALLPLRGLGPWAYVAGVAANAAAEDMYKQTAAGKKASKALGSGILTAGAETAMGALAEAKIPIKNLLKKIGMEGEDLLTRGLENVGIPATKEMINYIIDYLVDKMGRDPEAKWNGFELLLHALKGGVTGFAGYKSKGLFSEIEKVWEQLGE